MAPGNKGKTFKDTALSKRSKRTRSGRNKKKNVKSAKDKHLPESGKEPTTSLEPKDPEAEIRALVQKYDKCPSLDELCQLYGSHRITQINPDFRMPYSREISQFTIPMDLGLFETMTVPEYLRKYCKVVNRRQTYYKRFFVKYDKNKDGVLSVTEMEKAMTDVFNKISPGQVKQFLALTSEANGRYDSNVFYAVCALAERVFYSMYYPENPTETYSDKPCLEMADFPVILSRLGSRISEPLRSLFTLIVSSHGKMM